MQTHVLCGFGVIPVIFFRVLLSKKNPPSVTSARFKSDILAILGGNRKSPLKSTKSIRNHAKTFLDVFEEAWSHFGSF